MNKLPNIKFYDANGGDDNSSLSSNVLKFFVISESNDNYLEFVKKAGLPSNSVFWLSNEADADRDIQTNLKKGISVIKIFPNNS